jgi:hypothetical protein
MSRIRLGGEIKRRFRQNEYWNRSVDCKLSQFSAGDRNVDNTIVLRAFPLFILCQSGFYISLPFMACECHAWQVTADQPGDRLQERFYAQARR